MTAATTPPPFELDPSEQFWQYRPRPTYQGLHFNSPEELRAAAIEAFDWIHTHPIKKQLVFHAQGRVTKTYENVMRPFTFRAVAMRMGVSYQCLDLYRKRPAFAEVMEWIDDVIYTQKFEGAASNMLNANFIARDLGMADRSELTGKNGGPLQTQDVTDEEKLRDEARRLGIPLDAFGLSDPTEETE